MLTGQPKFAGKLRPYMSRGAYLECEWDDSESIWEERRGGRYVLLEPRFRLRGRGGYETLDEAAAASFRNDLITPFLVTPRTRAEGDPDTIEEVSVLCRRTSPLPETTPLYRRKDGRPVWRFEVEFEALAVIDAPPILINLGLLVDADGAMLLDNDEEPLLG
jgi:hypothetical protein